MRSNTMSQEDWKKLEVLTWDDFAPCPFCGERKAELQLDITHKKINPSLKCTIPFFVECISCCARAGMDLDPYNAIAKWNGRHYKSDNQKQE